MDLTIVGDVVVSQSPRRAHVSDPTAGDSAFGLLVRGDLTIGNLEVALTDTYAPTEKAIPMRAPRAGAAELKSLGFDLVSVATNHAMDQGVTGLRDTLAALDEAGVLHAGGGEDRTSASAAQIVEAAGRTVAFFSFCCTLPPGANATRERPGIAAIRVRQTFEYDGILLEEQPGTPPFVHSVAHEPDVVAAEELIRQARAQADDVVVAVHWGVPWCYLPTAQGPLAQYQRPLAHRLIEAGASVIIGHHPHSLHPVEFYGEGLILYSTGNFVFDWCEGFGRGEPAGDPAGRPSPPFGSALVSGPWYDSAVFHVRLNAEGPPQLQLTIVELDQDNQPLVAGPQRREAALRAVERASRVLDPMISVDLSGRVHRAPSEH